MLSNSFVDVQKNFNTRKALEAGVKPMGRSFTCKDLQMVKIKCSKDDARVHTLAHMFRANGVSLEKIYVRRSGNARESYLLFTRYFVFNCNISITVLVYMFICYILRCKVHIVLFLKS
jgi:hypothetical protein